MSDGERETGRQRSALDTRMLEIFVVVAESDSMTAAGQRLGLSQSGVSQALKHLEQALGVTLVDREVRPLALTEAGHDLHARACRILAEIGEAAYAARRAARVGPVHLRVGVVDSFATTVGPMLAHALRRTGGDCQMLSGQSAMHAEALRRRELDLVVTSDDALVSEAGFAVTPLLSEPVILALPAEYPGSGERLDEIVRDLELVRYSERAAIGRQVALHLSRLRLNPRSSLAFDSSEAVLTMVGAGLGFALTTPLCALPVRSRLHNVRFVPLPGPELRRHLSIGRHSGELEDLAGEIAAISLSGLRDECLSRVSELGEWLRGRVELNEGAVERPT